MNEEHEKQIEKMIATANQYWQAKGFDSHHALAEQLEMLEDYRCAKSREYEKYVTKNGRRTAKTTKLFEQSAEAAFAYDELKNIKRLAESLEATSGNYVDALLLPQSMGVPSEAEARKWVAVSLQHVLNPQMLVAFRTAESLHIAEILNNLKKIIEPHKRQEPLYLHNGAEQIKDQALDYLKSQLPEAFIKRVFEPYLAMEENAGLLPSPTNETPVSPDVRRILNNIFRSTGQQGRG